MYGCFLTGLDDEEPAVESYNDTAAEEPPPAAVPKATATKAIPKAAPKAVPKPAATAKPPTLKPVSPTASSTAASGPVLPGVGAVVETSGLSKDELNGLQGVVVRHQGDRVVVDLPAPYGEKALRPVNLRVITPAPTADGGPPLKRARAEPEPAVQWCGTEGTGVELDYWASITPESKVLIVGDGNFSFSFSLARRVGSAEQMVCTDAVMNSAVRDTAQHYLVPLLDMGATVCARLDATRLGKHCLVRRCGAYFDYILWNFPHSSTPNKADGSQEEHRQLLRRFLSQAELVLAKNGRCSITVKDGYPYDEWQVHTLASESMQFLGYEEFTAAKFPIYAHVTTRSGAGINRIFPAHTYVFGLKPGVKPGGGAKK